MKPYEHARSSAKRYGGAPEDYQEIHDFLDISKSAHPDMRHRAILHNSLGPYLAERVFGVVRTNSAGKTYSVRDVCEQHILEDMGFIPTLSNYLDGMPLYGWLGGRKKAAKRSIPLCDDNNNAD